MRVLGWRLPSCHTENGEEVSFKKLFVVELKKRYIAVYQNDPEKVFEEEFKRNPQLFNAAETDNRECVLQKAQSRNKGILRVIGECILRKIVLGQTIVADLLEHLEIEENTEIWVIECMFEFVKTVGY